MPCLEFQYIPDAQAVVSIGASLLADIDDDARGHQALERYLVSRRAGLGKVQRRIQVSASMLGRADRKGRVEAEAFDSSNHELLFLEPRRRGGPVQGPIIIPVYPFDLCISSCYDLPIDRRIARSAASTANFTG